MLHPIHTPKAFLSTTTLLAIFAAMPAAPAALLLSPEEGDVRVSAATGPADKDDGTFPGAYVFLTPFFGTSLDNPAPTVSVNGHIRFSSGDGDGDWHLAPLGLSGQVRISPMWHDFNIGSSGEVIEHVDPGFGYYGVTWSNLESTTHPGYHATFQAIFFEETTILHGNTFYAGDIAFSYGDLSVYDVSMDAIVGLENGFEFATLPEFLGTRGAASHTNHGDFPVGENEYILFRPDGLGNYDVSIQPIPEPAITLLSATGLLALLRRRRLH